MTRAHLRTRGSADDGLFVCTVNAVAWAPHELGPVLACASSDGKVSVLTFNSAQPLSDLHDALL